MKHFIDPVLKSASDLTDASKRIIDGGVNFFRSNLGKFPLFSSVIIGESDDDLDRDVKHYFLVPYRLSETGYALYTQRVLPQGVGPENDLPQARVFHLPANGTLSTLEGLLLEQLEKNQRQQISDDAPLADRLDVIAEEIDKQSNIVTGGLILIGGAVALANPLVGVGIAAKALLPTLGSKLSKHGINHVTNWMRNKKSESSDKQANSHAKKEVKRLSPEVEINETLALLEESLATTNPDHDPNLIFARFMNTPEQASKAMMTSSAISCIYKQCLDDTSCYEHARLHAADVTWLHALSELNRS